MPENKKIRTEHRASPDLTLTKTKPEINNLKTTSNPEPIGKLDQKNIVRINIK